MMLGVKGLVAGADDNTALLVRYTSTTQIKESI